MNTELYKGHYNVIAPLLMGNGTGDGKTTACVMAQAATIDALRRGKTLDKPTDEMECACPLLRRLAISINDRLWWESNEERTEHLRPLIPLLLDSRGSLALVKRRAARWTDVVVHELTPLRLEWIAAHTKNEKLKAGIAEKIKALAGIAPITDLASCNAAREILTNLKSYADADAAAAAAADAYADAAAYAAADAYADAAADADAYAYADADADAYAAAAAAADADADADADAQKIKYRTLAIETFKEIAAMKEES